ncbi:MAG: hypothetical protein HY554_09105 [Elusimicrobia bacterium]|nr:hypothetical protein [Elusimicrobiota bacterium]
MMTSFALVLIAALLGSLPSHAAELAYWDIQRKGANFFPLEPRKSRFEDAARSGIRFGRLAFNKWLNGRLKSRRGDFLLGPKGDYGGLVENDLRSLIQTLDDADRAGVKIVLTTLSLPGSRWLQHNCAGGKCEQQFDLWKDLRYHRQSAASWRDLARAEQVISDVVGTFDFRPDSSMDRAPAF